MFVNLISRLLGPRTTVRKRKALISASADVLEERALLAVTFQFDYSLDTRGFFDSSASRQALDLAGDILSSHLGDTLDAIAPSGSNTWTANFTHPGTGNATSQSNLTIEANELLIFVGGRDLGDGLARGGFGGFSWNGSGAWGEAVEFRGEASDGTDFARWGGSLEFNTSTNWHFGETVEGLESDEFDFLTVALHELTHAIGFARGHEAYDRLVSGSFFTGAKAVAEFDESGNVPLSGDLAHWRTGVLDSGRATLLDPQVNNGTRELPTFLDLAAIDDFGWEVSRFSTDWGDAPSNRYPTLSAQNGARHGVKAGLFLGVYGDGESNGQSSDDSDGYDDEDGVRFLDTLFSGDEARVDVTANQDGKLNAWIDFNLDGDWTDPGEHIFDDVDLLAGTNRLTFDIPTNARSGISYARFRLNSTGGLASTGAASDGEVEDYEVQLIDGVLAVDDTASVAASGTVAIDVTRNDIPSAQATVVSFTDPSKGTVTENSDGTLQFTADAGASGTTTFDYTVGLPETKEISSGPGDELGRAMAIFEDTFVVSAPQDVTGSGIKTGSVLIYTRSGSSWDLDQTITPSDGQAGDLFGFSVAIDGNTLVIGARSDDDDGLNAGSAYVYQRDSSTSDFVFSQKLLASTGRERDQFGYAVAIEGNAIFVSSRLDDEGGTNSGSVEYFSRPNEASEFEFRTRVRPDTVERGDQFGTSIVISGNTLFVGAYKDNNVRVNAGAVYVFARSGDNWNVTNQILPSKPEVHGYFGWSIAVSGNRLAIGQPARERPSRTGRLYVHDRSEGGTNNWGLVTRIDPENPTGANRFGASVSFSGDQIAVGAPRMRDTVTGGDVRIYERNVGGTDNWGRTHLETADDAGGGDEYGFSTIIAGDWLFAGARRDDDGGSNAGAVYFSDLRVDIGRVTITIG